MNNIAQASITFTSVNDWVVAWTGKFTEISGDHVATPNAFIGRKDADGLLCGIYMGGDMPNHPEGIYAFNGCPPMSFTQGYIEETEIFHINADGGYIGGWSFNQDGLRSANGIVNILAEGTVFAQNPNSTTPYWGVYADGHATFANGNVKFMADGSAEYAGKITSSSGSIGGWSINKSQLVSGRLIIDSANGFIGINANQAPSYNISTGEAIFPAEPEDGVKMWYSSRIDYGFAGWVNSKKVFQLGSSNMIAGWSFNHQAIWTGGALPTLTPGSFSSDTNSLTIAPNGIRSSKWYVDADGTASFVGGSVQFGTEDATMFGWMMRSGRLSANYVALVSDPSYEGLYLSVTDISEVSANNLRSTVSKAGGVYLCSSPANSVLASYDKKGNLGFRLSTSGNNKISDWTFDHEAIYTGSKALDDNQFTASANAIVLSKSGLFGYKWKMLADGSGSIAGNNISWDPDGKVTFSANVSLSWTSINGAPNLSKIDKDGAYLGTISADKIVAGTISSVSILNEGKWALNLDGSGYLACKNIEWNKDGDLSVNANISVRTMRYKLTDHAEIIDTDNWVANDAFLFAQLGGAEYTLPHLTKNECRVIKLLGAQVSRNVEPLVLKLSSSSDNIVVGTDIVGSTKYKQLDFGTIEALRSGVGYFELVGVGSNTEDSTTWFVIPVYTK